MAEGAEIRLEATERRALAFLEEDEATQLRRYLEPLTLPSGVVLAREGERMQQAAFLVEGRLAVKKETEYRGKFILLAVLESGAVVGEGALAGRDRHGAIMEAMEMCRLLVLSRRNFERLLDEQPHLAAQLLRRLLYVVGLRLNRAGERLASLL